MRKLTDSHVYNCCGQCKHLHSLKSKIEWVGETFYCRSNLSPFNNGFGYACLNYQKNSIKKRI